MKLFTSIAVVVLCITTSTTFAQSPQGFNYQAVVRDGNGTPIANHNVSIRLTLESSTGSEYFKESKTVSTNEQGVLSYIVGSGNLISGSFVTIPWNSGNIMMRVEIDPNGGTTYVQMGDPTKLQSVPYALYAENTKEVVSQSTAGDDDPIFVVKNKAGQIVFAVYQTGVRVYVEDSQITKGVRGGFAIGGLTNQSKGQEEYFRITPDSARIYVKETPSGKGVRGGFAIGGLTNQSKDITTHNLMYIGKDSTRIYIDDATTPKGVRGGFAIGGLTNQSKGSKSNFFNVETNSNGLISPSQPRVLWYPLKNAFLAGQVIVESPDSVGANSMATGYESKAKGQYSQAFGYKAIANGNYATSIGYQSIAKKDNSFAFGQWAQARNAESYAFGKGAIAEGFRSYALGSAGIDTSGTITGVAYAKGDYSFAIGQGSQSIGVGAFSIGIADSAKGNYSIAMGYETCSKGFGATSMGVNSSASGNKSIAMGAFATAIGSASLAMGYKANSSGTYSIALGNTNSSGSYAISIGRSSYSTNDNAISLGFSNEASGVSSLAMGSGTIASGTLSTALGFNTTASGTTSTAMGSWTTASGNKSMALGNYTTAQAYASLVLGQYNTVSGSTSSWIATEPVLVVGNGTSTTKHDALTLYKDGNMTIAGMLTQSSDIRLKENISPISNVLNKINNIQSVYFEFKDKRTYPAGRQIGFIAQEVEKSFPELVKTDAKGFLSVEYQNMSAILLQAIKEQQQIINKQQVEIDSLKSNQSEIESLKVELKELRVLLKK